MATGLLRTYKLKPYIQRSDGSAKGDWDVGITLDMIEFAKEIDVAVLAMATSTYLSGSSGMRTA